MTAASPGGSLAWGLSSGTECSRSLHSCPNGLIRSRTTAGIAPGAISSDTDIPLTKDRRRHTTADACAVLGSASTGATTGGYALGATTTGTMRSVATEASRSLLFQRVQLLRVQPPRSAVGDLGLA